LRAASAKAKMPQAHPPDTTGDATPCLMPSRSSARASGSPLISLRSSSGSVRARDAGRGWRSASGSRDQTGARQGTASAPARSHPKALPGSGGTASTFGTCHSGSASRR
jgi:hypothetical protein